MFICDYCGAEIVENSQRCLYCGRPVNSNLSVPTQISKFACPICKMVDKAEKVSEIRRHQVQDISGSVPVSSTNTDSNGKVHTSTSYQGFSGSQSSRLAQELCPPSRPYLPVKVGAGTKWILFPLILLSAGIAEGAVAIIGMSIALVFFKAEFLPEYLFAIPAAIVGAFLMYFFWSKWAKRRKREVESYPSRLAKAEMEIADFERAMQNWNKLYYCYRDGVVYIPGLGTSAPVEEMLDYIYQPNKLAPPPIGK